MAILIVGARAGQVKRPDLYNNLIEELAWAISLCDHIRSIFLTDTKGIGVSRGDVRVGDNGPRLFEGNRLIVLRRPG